MSRSYVALPLSGTVMGSLAGWLLSLNGRMGLAGWQWLFLVEGMPAVLLGALLFLLLPDGPEEARWLTEGERQWLVQRMKLERETNLFETQQGTVGLHGARGVLRDRRVWRLGLFELAALTVLYAYSFTAPLMLRQATRLSVFEIGWVVAGLGMLGGAAMWG